MCLLNLNILFVRALFLFLTLLKDLVYGPCWRNVGNGRKTPNIGHLPIVFHVDVLASPIGPDSILTFVDSFKFLGFVFSQQLEMAGKVVLFAVGKLRHLEDLALLSLLYLMLHLVVVLWVCNHLADALLELLLLYEVDWSVVLCHCFKFDRLAW